MDEYQLEFATGFGESYQNCPACAKEMVAGQKECYNCGVVVSRAQDRLVMAKTKQTIGGIDHLTSRDLTTLDKKWKQVVVNYHDQDQHQEFIKLCQANGALPFAVHHYSQMLEIDKEDDVAQHMRRQALSRITIQFDSGKPQAIKKAPIYLVNTLLKWLNWVGLALSSFCMTIGLFTPDAKNLVGLGVAGLLLFISLYLYRRS